MPNQIPLLNYRTEHDSEIDQDLDKQLRVQSALILISPSAIACSRDTRVVSLQPLSFSPECPEYERGWVHSTLIANILCCLLQL